MASKFQTHPRRHRGLVRRYLTTFYMIVIMLITMAPGYGGGDSDDGGGGGGGGCGSSGGGGGGPTGPPPSNMAAEAYSHFSGYDATSVTIPVGVFTETLTGETYIDQLLGGASNRLDVRLPGYSYYQGLIQANGHITIAGQVRVVGGVLGADDPSATASLYNGAMVTTNAHSFAGAGPALIGGPPGMRTRIKKWEEIPTP